MELKDIIIPFKEQLIYCKGKLGVLDINYCPIESKNIQKYINYREQSEQNSIRTTNLIKFDHFPDKQAANINYLKTYNHDKILDCVCQYWNDNNFDTYKEKFINKMYKNYQITGHADIIIYNKDKVMLGEVKNYLSGMINNEDFMYFIRQTLTYSYFLGIKTVYLFINNPVQYKEGIAVFKLNINKINLDYIQDLINTSIYIKDIKDSFKYKLPYKEGDKYA